MVAELIRAFRDDECGATAIEYGLIAGLIAVAVIGSFAIMGDALLNLMSDGTGSAATVITNQTGKID